MAQLSNTAEGGTNGSTVTTGNSGGASGDSFIVNKTSAASNYTFSTTWSAHGTKAYYLQMAASEACQLYWTFADNSQPAAATRGYFYFTNTTPAATASILTIRRSGGIASGVALGTDGRLQITNTSSTVRYTSSVTLSTSTVYRIELRVIAGTTTANGTIEFALYAGDSTTPLDSWLSAAENTNTVAMVETRFGRSSTIGPAFNVYVDSMCAEAGRTSLIGRYSTPPYVGWGAAT